MWTYQGGNNAHGCVPVVLRVRAVPRRAAPQTWRLLRLLLVRDSGMSTRAEQQQGGVLQLLTIQDRIDTSYPDLRRLRWLVQKFAADLRWNGPQSLDAFFLPTVPMFTQQTASSPSASQWRVGLHGPDRAQREPRGGEERGRAPAVPPAVPRMIPAQHHPGAST